MKTPFTRPFGPTSLSSSTPLNLKMINATTATNRMYSVEVWPLSSFKNSVIFPFITRSPCVGSRIFSTRTRRNFKKSTYPCILTLYCDAQLLSMGITLRKHLDFGYSGKTSPWPSRGLKSKIITGSGWIYKFRPYDSVIGSSPWSRCARSPASKGSDCEKPKVITNSAHLKFKGRETNHHPNRPLFSFSIFPSHSCKKLTCGILAPIINI